MRFYHAEEELFTELDCGGKTYFVFQFSFLFPYRVMYFSGTKNHLRKIEYSQTRKDFLKTQIINLGMQID